jgi:hypothetical protein
MGRETKIYKLNCEKAKTKLYFIITSKTQFKEPFIDFLEKRNINTEKEILYENICLKVKSNINSILPSELFELTYWLSENESNSENIFNDNGLEPLFNLHGKAASAFMFQYGTFSDFFELRGIEEDFSGYSFESSYFIFFLDYMILLMKKIIEQQFDNYKYEFTKNDFNEIIKINEVYNNNSKIYQAINSEFEYLNKCWKNYNNEDEINFGELTPEIGTIFNAEIFFEECIKVKNSISELNTHILVIES